MAGDLVKNNPRKNSINKRHLSGMLLLSFLIIFYTRFQVQKCTPPSNNKTNKVLFNVFNDKELLHSLAQHSLKIATKKTVITCALTNNMFEKYGAIIFNNIVLGIKYGYGFHLDSTNHEFHNDSKLSYDPRFLKIFVFLNLLNDDNKYQNRFDSVLWIDGDIILMDRGHDFLDQIVEEYQDSDLIMVDDNLFNNGLMFLRFTPWTKKFVNDWMQLSQLYNGTFYFADNGSLHYIILDYLENIYRTSKCPYKRDGCLEHRAGSPQTCLQSFMSCIGRTRNSRTRMGKITLLPTTEPRYRLNQWYFGVYKDRNSNQCKFKELYGLDIARPYDDIGLHTKFPEQILSYDNLKPLIDITKKSYTFDEKKFIWHKTFSLFERMKMLWNN